ncbi:PQ loop repeat protein [Penicillium brasilianum]|uniref:PQ loop repeat protein n=1 Tax=Penicillium brasilianum TaxID=104259 RepID=A0A1S9S284_PENBI|nr:PQ loop repeat protein [Penicillium brasilianum]
MFPPLTANLNIEALSGICGSISIACWVVVFSPQIIENFRRGSADGLSLLFLIVWLAGDVFNILGAVMQGVLPTMIILAVYYTLADIVLLGQCFYYRGFNLSDEFSSSPSPEPSPVATGALDSDEGSGSKAGAAPTERSALLTKSNGHVQIQDPLENAPKAQSSRDGARRMSSSATQERRPSASSFRDFVHQHVDGTHLSPATPLIDPESDRAHYHRRRRRISTIQAILFNTTAIALVCAAGILGWYVSAGSKKSKSEPESLTLDPLGQAFGYLCAVFYLGSRVPQLLLNYRRKSTDGVSLLFFLFACIGNLTYVLSIMAYSPVCQGTVSASNSLGKLSHRHRPHCRPGEAAALYGRYILVNLSWLVGSFGTLLLDMAIFVQFFLYSDGKSVDEEYDGE